MGLAGLAHARRGPAQSAHTLAGLWARRGLVRKIGPALNARWHLRQATSLGVRVTRTRTIDEFRDALRQAKAAQEPVLVQVETDPLVPAPGSESWWDVPVAEVSNLDSTRKARRSYELSKARQRNFLAADASPDSEPVRGASR